MKFAMNRANVPTAHCAVFSDAQAARDHINKVGAPLVIKADGLAAGKGVIIAQTLREALDAIDEIMANPLRGSAAERKKGSMSMPYGARPRVCSKLPVQMQKAPIKMVLA